MTVKMKKMIIKMSASNDRQHPKQLLSSERCSWKMLAVRKSQKMTMRHLSRRVCTVTHCLVVCLGRLSCSPC